MEPASGLGDQLARRIAADQCDDLSALIFCNACLTVGARTVAEPIYAQGIEAVDAFSDGFGVTAEPFGDLGVANPLSA